MDRIILSGIELYAHGGVSDAEKAVGQRYRVHLVLELDLRAAAESDDIVDTIDYGRVYAVVAETMRERPFNLLESAAGRIAGRLLDRFPVERVSVQVEKLLPPIDGVVATSAVRITRERD